MRVALISPATIAEFGPEGIAAHHVRDLAQHVPVGALTLTAILLARGYDASFIDMNTVYADYAHERPRAARGRRAAPLRRTADGAGGRARAAPRRGPRDVRAGRDAALATSARDARDACTIALQVLRERGWIVGETRGPRHREARAPR